MPSLLSIEALVWGLETNRTNGGGFVNLLIAFVLFVTFLFVLICVIELGFYSPHGKAGRQAVNFFILIRCFFFSTF